MDENEVIKKLESAKLSEFSTVSHKALLKTRLIKYAARGTKPVKAHGFHRYIFAAAVVAVCAFSAVTYYVVDNMESGTRFNKRGGVWSTYSDKQQGGDSAVWPPEYRQPGEGFVMSAPGYGGTGYAVRITGTTGPKLGFNYNYLGVVARFTNKSSCPTCEGTDIKKYNGIRFKVKGSLAGGTVSFILPCESNKCIMDRKTCESLTDYADYEKDITASIGQDWNTVQIVFRDDLKQPRWAGRRLSVPIGTVLGNVHLFKWQYKNGNGAIMDLWINDVELF
jgi:hypothetical protein